MNSSPQQQIRAYLDEHGGQAKVPAIHLLTSWQVERFTDENRWQIQEDLARAGVDTDPPLAELRETDEVVLYIPERKPVAGGIWTRFRAWPTWAQIVAPVAAVFVLIGVLAGGDEEQSNESPAGGTTTETTDTTAEELRQQREKIARERERLREERAAARRERARARRARARRARLRRQRELERQQQLQAQAEQQRLEEEQQQLQEQAAACHPSYDPCLDPNASDYDCEGGSGDGPNYTGPVSVTGPDDYDLDADGDGYACE